MKHLDDATTFDRLLGGTSTTESEEHVAGCSACRMRMESLQELASALRDTPLDMRPPGDLEDHVFELVARDRTIRALEETPLAPAPPADLEERVMGAVQAAAGSPSAVVDLETKRRGVRTRVLAVAAVFALGAIGGGALVQTLESGGSEDLTEMPEGHPVQVVALEGSQGSVNLELVHFRHDNYRLELHTEHFPVQRPGHHYELWLSGAGGEVLAGSFRLERDDEVTFVFNLGIDPAMHTDVEIREEPDSGDGSGEGRVVASGKIDPDDVERQ